MSFIWNFNVQTTGFEILVFNLITCFNDQSWKNCTRLVDFCHVFLRTAGCTTLVINLNCFDKPTVSHKYLCILLGLLTFLLRTFRCFSTFLSKDWTCYQFCVRRLQKMLSNSSIKRVLNEYSKQ